VIEGSFPFLSSGRKWDLLLAGNRRACTVAATARLGILAQLISHVMSEALSANNGSINNQQSAVQGLECHYKSLSLLMTVDK
jgi:hypothetical protein